MLSFLLSALLALTPASEVVPVAPVAAPTGSYDPCKIFGSVYLETDPRRRGNCFGTVYIEPEEAFANLIVFKESNKLFADKAGLWAEAPNREFADYALFVTTNRGQADFSIHYTTVRSFAGCKN